MYILGENTSKYCSRIIVVHVHATGFLYYFCGLPLQYYCDTIVSNIYACLNENIKNTVGLFCTYGYHQFSYGKYCQNPIILLKCMGYNSIYILLPFNFHFAPNQTILKIKSLGLKTIETIAIVKKLLPILLTLPLFYRCSNIA